MGFEGTTTLNWGITKVIRKIKGIFYRYQGVGFKNLQILLFVNIRNIVLVKEYIINSNFAV